jgi:hypothetical protein
MSTYKPHGVRVEAARDRIHHSQFTQCVDDVEDHDTHEREADEHGSWATTSESATGPNEKASTNRTSNGLLYG